MSLFSPRALFHRVVQELCRIDPQLLPEVQGMSLFGSTSGVSSFSTCVGLGQSASVGWFLRYKWSQLAKAGSSSQEASDIIPVPASYGMGKAPVTLRELPFECELSKGPMAPKLPVQARRELFPSAPLLQHLLQLLCFAVNLLSTLRRCGVQVTHTHTHTHDNG
jgi:hypothetical protein